MENAKIKLAEALEEEKVRLPEYSEFGDRNNLEEYDQAILYLKTGEKPDNYYENELLLSCIEDIDTMLKDYGILP